MLPSLKLPRIDAGPFGFGGRKVRDRGKGPSDWRGWLTKLFPAHVARGFAKHHEEYWNWLWAIEPDSDPRPFVGIWPRGGGKSTGAELGVDPDELEVASAVRMSMSIPLFFEPVRWTNPEMGREHLIVDGGMLSNFPVWLFDAPDPLRPTIGMKLSESDARAPLAPGGDSTGMLGYLRALVDTMMEAHDRLYLEEHDFARTIAIDTLGVRTTEFDLSRERAAELHESGRLAAERYLDGPER